MAAEQPNNNALQSDVGLSLGKLSEALRASGDGKGALALIAKASRSPAHSPTRIRETNSFEPTSCSRCGG